MGTLKSVKFAAAIVCLGIILVSSLLKKGERIRGFAFIAAWVLPGAGHALMGKWKKGLFFFAILAATYLFGMWIVGFRPVSFDDNPFYFVGQYGSGATLLVAALRGAEKAILRPDIHPSWFDPGLLYVCVVGLLNLVVMLNVLELRNPQLATPPPQPAAPPVPAPALPASEKTA